MSNLNESLSEFRPKLLVILPVILIMLLIGVDIAAGVLLILPTTKDHTSLMEKKATQQSALDAARTERQGASDTLQTQVDNIQARMNKAAGNFLSPAEADNILDRIYGYASSSGAEITALQLQPPQEGETTSYVYDVRLFKLQIEGTFAQLVVFLTLFRESSVLGVNLNNLTVTANGTRDLLTIDMVLYTSPYATGDILASLPVMKQPAPMATPLPTPTVLPPTPTLTPVPSTQVPVTATPTTYNGTVLGPGTYDDSSPALQYLSGTWESLTSQTGFGGSYHYSTDAVAEVQFAFIGTAVGIQYVGFRNFGIFEIYVDGKLWGEVDSYAADGTFGQVIYISGLEQSAHVINLRNTSRRNPTSEGNIIAIDVIYVLQSTQAVPSPGG